MIIDQGIHQPYGPYPYPPLSISVSYAISSIPIIPLSPQVQRAFQAQCTRQLRRAS